MEAGTAKQNVSQEENYLPEVTPYDNDVTLLYKWAKFFVTPTRLIIVRPRTELDNNIEAGTSAYVFEPLIDMIRRLSSEGETPVGIYDFVKSLKPTINTEDIVMYFFFLYYSSDPNNQNLYQIINRLYTEIEGKDIEKFTDQESLIRAFTSWFQSITREKIIEEERLKSIIDIQSKLSEVDQEPKIPISPVKISSSIMSFSPTIEDRMVTVEDGLDIFNKAIVSKYIPYIKYNDKHGRSFSRVYTGGKVDNEANYNITVLPNNESNTENSIYMTLWLGDPNSDGSDELHDATRDSFSKVRYHLDTNYLTVESPLQTDTKKGLIEDQRVAYNRAQNALPSVFFGEGREVKVRGDFDMYGIPFDETTFVDMILIEPLMNVYLYMEEKDKPFALKKRLDIHYRSIFTDEGEGATGTDKAYITNSASASVTLIPKTATSDQVIEILGEDGTVSKNTLQVGTPYIHINILQAESRDIIGEFIPIFKLLMRYYFDHQGRIAEEYNHYLPGLKEQLDILLTQRKHKTITSGVGILEITKKKAAVSTSRSKIKFLRGRAPELFVLNYARRCQCPLQPIIIDPEEVEAWKQRKIRVGTNLYERQIMPFPPNDPKWLIVCPDDDNPHPGVKPNHDLPNRKEFPYIPCCFKKDQMSPSSNSKYMDYVKGRKVEKKTGAKSDNKISTRKIRGADKIAFLPRSVNDILKKYSEEYVDIVRYGMPYTVNSLLHCACNAIDDPNYINLPTEEQKEAYVVRVRQHIIATIRPSLLKQELYDYSDEEIMNLLSNPEQFLDPSLFFRAVEETFNINIYTFKPSPPISNEIDLGTFDVPRFKIFHSRPPRLDRPTMVIIKMGGSESDALEYPQCELIVDYDKDNSQIVKLFGPRMTEICHSTLQRTIRTITWSVPNNIINTGLFEVHSNIYYYIDHKGLFKLPAVSQFIDDNGKMRAITLDIGQNRLMTIAIIPSQPENLPVTNVVSRVPIDIALNIFGKPDSITRDAQGNVDGLWYEIMDVKFGEYVAIIPSANYGDDIPLGLPNPIESFGISIMQRLSKLKRTLNIIVQLVRWLYELARAERHMDPTTFVMNFMRVDQSLNIDSANYYDLSQIPRRLPVVDNIQAAMTILEAKAPTLFSGKKIIMYDDTFANRILKMLRDYDDFYPALQPMSPNVRAYIDKLCITNDIQSITELRNIATALKVNKPQSLSKTNLCSEIRARYKDSIDNFYETEQDFDQVPNSKIFMNEKDLKAWMISLKSSHNYSRYFNIRDKLDINSVYSTNSYYKEEQNIKINPYIYKDEDGKIYIIQGIIGGSKAKAISVASAWFSHKVNIGSDPKPSDSIPIHMVYTISPSSKMEPAEDLTNGQDLFLKILYYGSRQDLALGRGENYAAILEIL